MRYPTVNLLEAREFLAKIRIGERPVPPEVMYVGNGESTDQAAIEEFVAQIREHYTAVASMGRKEAVAKFESTAAETVYRFAQQLKPDVVMDCGFWCYLSLHKLLDVVQWRHPGTEKSPAAFSNFAADRTQFREALLVRLYLRGALGVQSPTSDGDDDFSLVEVGGQDVWRSHIFRVKIGNAPSLVHALLRLIAKRNLSVQTVRVLAKRLTQLRSNILFETLDPEQAQVAMDAAHSHISS